jgi:hypothetical protein
MVQEVITQAGGNGLNEPLIAHGTEIKPERQRKERWRGTGGGVKN